MDGSSINIDLETNDLRAYLINNTIISNTTEGTNANSIGGITISSQDTTQALIASNVFLDNDIHQLNLIGGGYKYLINNNIAGTQIGVKADVLSNNFSTIPIFETGLFNYTPIIGSALIDAGTHPPDSPTNDFEDNWSIIAHDLNGFMRIQGSKVDIGAYESATELVISINGFEKN